ncbi:hypothetical protein H4R35_001052 [Dimargaris xerosporica]|nr:hypothetical protein H4R35_001052 [Dimargaris xerosporica]
MPLTAVHSHVVLRVTRPLGNCCSRGAYAIVGSPTGRGFSGPRRAWRWLKSDGDDSYEAKLSKLKASKQRHDKYLYDKIHQHLQKQLDRRTSRQTQSYQSAIGHALGNVHSILDVANKQRLRDTITQGKKEGGKESQDAGDWAAFDTLVETEAVPQGWFQNPWFSVTVISVLVMRAEYGRALRLFHQLQVEGNPLTPPAYFGALKAALQVESLTSAASTEQSAERGLLVPSALQRTGAMSVTDAIFNEIQAQGIRPGSMGQYRHVLDYHMTRQHTDAVVATWNSLVSLGQPLPADLCFRLLSYLCCAHAIDQATIQFRRLAPSLRSSIVSGLVGHPTASCSKSLPPLPPWKANPPCKQSPFALNDGPTAPDLAILRHHQVQTAIAFLHSGRALEAYNLLMLVLEHIYHEYSFTTSSHRVPTDHSTQTAEVTMFPHTLLVDTGQMLIQQRCWPLALDMVHAMAYFHVPIPTEWQAYFSHDADASHWQLKPSYLANDQAAALPTLYPSSISAAASPTLGTKSMHTPKSPLRQGHHDGSASKPAKHCLSLLDLFPSPWQQRS